MDVYVTHSSLYIDLSDPKRGNKLNLNINYADTSSVTTNPMPLSLGSSTKTRSLLPRVSPLSASLVFVSPVDTELSSILVPVFRSSPVEVSKDDMSIYMTFYTTS